MGDNKISLNIQVFCRVRPPTNSDEIGKENGSISYPNDESICLSSGKVYSFDKIYTPQSSQNDIYNGTAKSIIKDVLNGYNATVFAYGTTSSGKTFTMEGNLKNKDEMGIMPRIGSDIFHHINSSENKYEIKISFIEIYLEKIRDLLDEMNEKTLSVYESKNKPPTISGVKEVIVKNFEEFLAQLRKGCINRVVSATDMNERSSRSHSIMQIVIQQENPNTQQKLIGKLLLVDLAGSEVLSNSNSEIFRESKYINKSLSTLAHVISELSKRSKHIPYRDSILTRLLKESLGGNAKTIIIICVSPSSLTQTKCSLAFGSRAKVVRNNVSVNKKTESKKWKAMFEKANLSLQSLQSYVQELEKEITKLRNGEEVPKEQWVQFPEVKDSSVSFCNTPDSSFFSVLNHSNAPVEDDSEEVISLKNQVDSLERQIADFQNLQISVLAEQENIWIKFIEKERFTAEQKCSDLNQTLNALTKENDLNVREIERYKSLSSRLEEDLACLRGELFVCLEQQKNIEKCEKSHDDKINELQLTLKEKTNNEIFLTNKIMDLKENVSSLSLKSLDMSKEMQRLEKENNNLSDYFHEIQKYIANEDCNSNECLKENKSFRRNFGNESVIRRHFKSWFTDLKKKQQSTDEKISILRSEIQCHVEEKLKIENALKLSLNQTQNLEEKNSDMSKKIDRLEKENKYFNECFHKIKKDNADDNINLNEWLTENRNFRRNFGNGSVIRIHFENLIKDLKKKLQNAEEKNAELSAKIQCQNKEKLEIENSLMLCLTQLESERRIQMIIISNKEIEKLRDEKNEVITGLEEDFS